MSLSINFPTQSPTLLLDFANARILDPRITFARNTTGVYYDGITTAVAEQNLLVQSQSLAAGTWTVLGMGLSDNAAVAPDGTTTATRITETAVTSEHYASQTLSTFPGGAFVFSCYLKKGTLATAPDWAQLACGGTNSGYVSVNLATGVIGNTGGFTSTAIADVGNGWYRVSVTSTVAGGAISFRIGTTNNTNAATRHVTYLGSTTSDVLVWGAQVENRATLTAYTATTTAVVTNYIPVLLTAAVNTARFTADPITGTGLGLLMEIGRTNLQLQSGNITQAPWGLSRASAGTAGSVTTAPDGTNSGYLLIPNTENNFHYVSGGNIACTGSTTYTWSIYCKAGGYKYARLRAGDNVSFLGDVVADLETGAFATGAATNKQITPVGNGWYRLSIAVTTNSSATTLNLQLWVFGTSGGTYVDVFAGNGFSGIFVWGAQREEGAFATTYIATTTVAVPRGEETAAMTGANFTSWFNNGEGTFYIESTFEYQGASNFPRLVAAVGTNPNTDEIAISTRTTGVGAGAGQTICGTIVAGTGVGEIFPSGQTVLGSTNAAFAYKLNDLAASVFRIPVEADTTATIPACVALRIYGRSRFQQPLTGIVKKIAYYDTRLPNAQLATLTAN